MAEARAGLADEAGQVREEDAFDAAAVGEWLRGQGVVVEGDLEVRQFAGGASNLTYALRSADRDLILRRPPSGQKAKGAHDMGREYRIQSALQDAFGLVPEMVAFCDDESVIGSEFYVMERIDGIILRRDLPPELGLDVQHVRQLCTNALDVLVALHQVDVDTTGLTSLGKGSGYVERQVSGWSSRFRKAHTDDVGDYEQVIAWLSDHQPADVATCLIHNDFRFDNLVLAPDDPMRVIGVLDWEMATLGDPLMDLAGALAYWTQADDDEFFMMFRRQPTHEPGMLTRAEVQDYYCDRMGLTVTADQWRWYEVFGLFRLAVIIQQIYYRYVHKQTTNEQFAIFGDAARYLEQRCLGLID